MQTRLVPLAEQVMVITGASSGIGLVTAKQAAQRGPAVVLVARNERDLRRAVDAIRNSGGRAMYVVADVADLRHVQRVASATLAECGRIDTWVNNAAVSMYGRCMDVPIEDLRRQMEVNSPCDAAPQGDDAGAGGHHGDCRVRNEERSSHDRSAWVSAADSRMI